MQIINYLLASIVSYLGLLVGIILVRVAPEEQKPGKKYFILIKKIIFFLIVAFLLVYYKINFIFSLLALLIIGIIIIGKKLEKSEFAYFLLGIVFFISSKMADLFIIESVLVFLYGITAASLLLNLKKKNYVELFIKNLWFFTPIISLYFII